MSETPAWMVVSTVAEKCWVNTLSSTRRGAIVNWLVAEERVNITRFWDDLMIERAWKARNFHVEAKEVRVSW